MLSTAIVIFREVFEIVLIVGIILAATAELAGRKRWIALGFGAGFAGAAAIAFLTGEISEMAEGMGQEVFNAIILYTAAAVIGWTVLWMKKHAKEIKAHFHKVGMDISEGATPFYTLSIVIALAIFREGAEIVLFTYGMLAAGQSIMDIALGAVLGASGGLVIGFLVYKGLISLSPKHFLQVTSWLLVLLVAGMAAQATNYLTMAGYFSNLSHVVWDSSFILADNNIAGQTLHVLLGYTARPTAVQLMVYGATLVGLIGALRLVGGSSKTKQQAA